MEQNVRAEGLFRVPPHSKLRDVLKEAYDRGQKYIVWKDNGAVLPLPPYPHAEHQNDIITDIDPKDAYSVFMAAALIKAWYANLRQPVFTATSYRELKRLYGDPDDLPDVERLTELLSPSSQWSFLPAVSRESLVRHLLPLLSAVAAHEEQNKMTAENLAVCIAPALLCGPDQLEDAKMSSIVRRILTEAIELWPQGLREACGQTEAIFEEELKLPQDKNDWEDPLDGKGAEERKSWDENQSTGIILLDNEATTASLSTAARDAPPLPPRMGVTSGRSLGDTITKRKPAPPLQVPPRYSTIITDNPLDTTDSPLTYAATTDGFAPRQEDSRPASQHPDEKKSGTSFIDSSAPLSFVLPKRKALTAEQIDSAEHGDVLVQARRASEELEKEAEKQVGRSQVQKPIAMRGMPLPGLANVQIQEAPNALPVKRKAVPCSTFVSEETISPTSASTDMAAVSPTAAAATALINEFCRPSLPAPANRTPHITSLARPVYPTMNPTTSRPPSKSASLPVPTAKPRTPSPALLKKMPSFEQSTKADNLSPPITPRRLNLKKKSVDDLRRLYEERAGTASVLVAAGRKRN
jgi:Rho GTPase-activating protein 1